MYQIRKKAIVRRMKGVDKKTVFFFTGNIFFLHFGFFKKAKMQNIQTFTGHFPSDSPKIF